MKILIVEDNHALTDTLRDFMEVQGYTVDAQDVVEGALTKMLSGEYQFILLDVDLPDGTGLELCRQFRDKGGRTPVMIMTGHDLEEDKELGFDAGADDYITKPFGLREINARIKAINRRATDYSASPLALKADHTLGQKYKLMEQIGEGGMANIWLAKDSDSERLVVIKVLKEEVTTPAATKRFSSEFKLLARVNHPNVVALYDVGYITDHVPYLVMEFVKGDTLRDILGREGPLPLIAVLQILIQVCNGLQEAHDAGVVHRDLKPENIILQDRSDRPDAVKIVDFGIARDIDTTEERLTKPGIVVGTLEYLSPEQLSDKPVDGRSDIYALGVIAFELMTGRMPFTATSTESLMAKQLVEDPPQLSDCNQLLKPADEIVATALRKRPQNRYQTAKEMREAIEVVLARIARSLTS